MQMHVKVFRRTGKPCYSCGAVIQRVKLGGRSTHYCPKCQK
jgi:formamidopyrimidine-DNA glycosylase